MTSPNNTALVTGSTSGIGLAIARAMAAAGHNVVITGFGDPAQIDNLLCELRERHGVGCVYVPADLSKPDQIQALVSGALERFGSVSILVNNAGIQHVAPIHEFPEDRWDQILAVNLSAAFHTTKALLPHMRTAGWGRIINIASAHALVASPSKSAYVASKHGLLGLTKVTALENGAFGITANAICPGWTRTPLAEKQVADRAAQAGSSIEQEELKVLLEKQAVPAFTTPEQVAGLAVFLCSAQASTITGSALSIDGGWVAQ